MIRLQTFSVAIIAALSTSVFAGISTYTSESSLIESITNNANFNSLVNFQSLLDYEENGLVVSVDRSYYSWDAPGLDGSEMFYAGTGSLEMVEISLDDGEFVDLDMQISSGWLDEGPAVTYLWVQLYSGNTLVQEFDIDLIGGEYLGFEGGGFDQILIGSYVNQEIRDLHDASQRNTVAIDNINAGTIPAPGTLAVPAMLLAGLRRKRA